MEDKEEPQLKINNKNGQKKIEVKEKKCANVASKNISVLSERF